MDSPPPEEGVREKRRGRSPKVKKNKTKMKWKNEMNK
jgi:hypothetical protein